MKFVLKSKEGCLPPPHNAGCQEVGKSVAPEVDLRNQR